MASGYACSSNPSSAWTCAGSGGRKRRRGASRTTVGRGRRAAEGRPTAARARFPPLGRHGRRGGSAAWPCRGSRPGCPGVARGRRLPGIRGSASGFRRARGDLRGHGRWSLMDPTGGGKKPVAARSVTGGGVLPAKHGAGPRRTPRGQTRRGAPKDPAPSRGGGRGRTHHPTCESSCRPATDVDSLAPED